MQTFALPIFGQRFFKSHNPAVLVVNYLDLFDKYNLCLNCMVHSLINSVLLSNILNLFLKFKWMQTYAGHCTYFIINSKHGNIIIIIT